MKKQTPEWWDNQPLGMIPDKELALRIGCSATAVGKQRSWRKIPPKSNRTMAAILRDIVSHGYTLELQAEAKRVVNADNYVTYRD